MKPELLIAVLLALGVGCAATTYLSVSRFMNPRKGERRRVSDAVGGMVLACLFGFAAAWVWLNYV